MCLNIDLVTKLEDSQSNILILYGTILLFPTVLPLYLFLKQ